MTTDNKYSRLLSLDVFRGFTIALMILVNSPGNPTPYPWLEHSPWNGCTLADLVFPFFVFIVGLSSVFSLAKAREIAAASRGQLFGKIVRRSLIIFLLGLLLNLLPNHFDLANLRILGVLQRIALCYFFSSLLFLTTSMRTQALILAGLLLTYWFILGNSWTLEDNLAAQIDQLLLAPGHLYGGFYDPEGFLSTLPALATALLGNLTGFWLLSRCSPAQKLGGMMVFGILSLLAGEIWSLWFPINKTLWTSSYVLWTGGYALLVLAFCYWLIEIRQIRKWSKPFEIFGTNAMAAYVPHVFFLKVQAVIRIPQVDGSNPSLKLALTNTLFGWASAENAALLYALSYTLFWLFVLSILYRRKLFFKI